MPDLSVRTQIDIAWIWICFPGRPVVRTWRRCVLGEASPYCHRPYLQRPPPRVSYPVPRWGPVEAHRRRRCRRQWTDRHRRHRVATWMGRSLCRIGLNLKQNKHISKMVRLIAIIPLVMWWGCDGTQTVSLLAQMGKNMTQSCEVDAAFGPCRFVLSDLELYRLGRITN